MPREIFVVIVVKETRFLSRHHLTEGVPPHSLKGKPGFSPGTSPKEYRPTH